MNNTHIILKGSKKFHSHEGLIKIIRKYTSWNRNEASNFLRENPVVHFKNMKPEEVVGLLSDLENEGFEIHFRDNQSEVEVEIGLTSVQDAELIQDQIKDLEKKLQIIKDTKADSAANLSIKESALFRRFEAMIGKGNSSEVVRETSIPMEKKEVKKPPQKYSEGEIGKFWLSRVGILVLVLGIVFFIGYSFKYIGPWGKVLIGLMCGGLLVGGGNYLARKENFENWAMAVIGGGWSILYFTAMASHHIPQARIIESPLIGFFFLLIVASGAIIQSLKFKSQILVFFSYFLAYFAIVLSDSASIYALVSSFLLTVSLVIVTRRLGWGWLSVFALVAVYGIHAIWKESLPGLAQLTREQYIDFFLFPWLGNQWDVYPLLNRTSSLVHQGFLIMYWVLFAIMGWMRDRSKHSDETRAFVLVLLNNFIFTFSYIHHLHVYYPDARFVFALIMGGIFAALAYAEKKKGSGLLSDLYLASSISLLAISVPMCFDGSWITYSWSAMCAVFALFGIRRNRILLRSAAWILSTLLFMRLFVQDHMESQVVMHVYFAVKSSFFLYLAVSITFFLIYMFYRRSEIIPTEEKKLCCEIYPFVSMSILAIGFLIGGLREIATFVWIAQAVFLMAMGVRDKSIWLRIVSVSFVMTSVVRIFWVDNAFAFANIFSDAHLMFRHAIALISIGAIIGMGEWTRRLSLDGKTENWNFPLFFIFGVLLSLQFFHDPILKPLFSMIWGLMGALLVIFGFICKERFYRWSGLGLFALTVLRLFLHDLRHLDMIYKIISFIILGLVLIGVSYLYGYYSKLLPVKAGGSKAD